MKLSFFTLIPFLFLEIFRKFLRSPKALLRITGTASGNDIIFRVPAPATDRDLVFLMKDHARCSTIKAPMIILGKYFLPFGSGQCGWQLFLASMTYCVMVVHLLFVGAHPLTVVSLELLFVLFVIRFAILPLPGFAGFGLISPLVDLSITFSVIVASFTLKIGGMLAMRKIIFGGITGGTKAIIKIFGYPLTLGAHINLRRLPGFSSKVAIPTQTTFLVGQLFATSSAVFHVNLSEIGYTMIIPYNQNWGLA